MSKKSVLYLCFVFVGITWLSTMEGLPWLLLKCIHSDRLLLISPFMPLGAMIDTNAHEAPWGEVTIPEVGWQK
jgi:hypothetical protein